MGTRGKKRRAGAALPVGVWAPAVWVLMVCVLVGCAVDTSGYDGTREPTGRSELGNPDRVDVLQLRAESKGRSEGEQLRGAKIEAGVEPGLAGPTETECKGRWRLRGHEATLGEGNIDRFVAACSAVSGPPTVPTVSGPPTVPTVSATPTVPTAGESAGGPR
ncbi:hypothetical protein [Streptomyces sp. NPDC054863]